MAEPTHQDDEDVTVDAIDWDVGPELIEAIDADETVDGSTIVAVLRAEAVAALTAD